MTPTPHLTDFTMDHLTPVRGDRDQSDAKHPRTGMRGAARHALASERTDVLPRPAFAYTAPTSPLPDSAPAFEHQFLPLHGLRLPPGAEPNYE